MGLKEEKESLIAQIEEAKKREEEMLEQPEPAQEPENEEEKEPEKEEEKEPEKEEEPKKEEKPKTNADYARERIERIEMNKLREELAAANARIETLQAMAKPEPKQVQDVEPNKSEDPLGWADWRARQAEKRAQAAEELARRTEALVKNEEKIRKGQELEANAQNELLSYEVKFKAGVTDYEDVKSWYIGVLAASVKNLNPSISDQDLGKIVSRQIMMRASNYLTQGYENPVIGIYEEAKSMGYRPREEAEPKEEKKSPDLSRVAKNRERNAGMAAAQSGEGRGDVTRKYAAEEMTAAEWARMPKDERYRLMRSV